MSINFPLSLDDDTNLYLVHDALRLRLAEDYNPGDTSIQVDPDPLFTLFPSTGIITLTEQCSDLALRAISFEYTSKGTNSFQGLALLPNFVDVIKPKRITDVTLNVVAPHHNQIKDALIAIQRFAGVQGDTSLTPLTGSMEARVNFLRNLVLSPKSWFSSNRSIGIVPLTVTFTDQSTRDPDTWVWDFGDGTTETITRTNTTVVGDVTKTYNTPGVYDVTLTVTNSFGTNTSTIPQFVTARVQAPDPATITFIPASGQVYNNGVIRTKVSQIVSALVQTNGSQALDPVVKYIWEFNDDLQHDTTSAAEASYSIGGLYDVKLRTVTELGSYRITTFPDVIDVVEKFNIWHFIFDSTAANTATTKTLYAYEFGLLSETYKAASVSTALPVTRDAGFLTGVPNQPQQYAEFRRNNGFSARSLTGSGDGGSAVIYWAEGAPTAATQQVVRFREFNGFNNTWTTPVLGNGMDNVNRQWNWLSLDSGSDVYFLFGAPGPGIFAGSPTNQDFQDIAMTNYSITDILFSSVNYLNNASELMTNVGGGTAGDFSVYRGVWKDSNGYFVRNDGTGTFFRLKSFYATSGTISNPVQTIRKLTDMPGATKFEGQMVALSGGIYFFNNTGEVTVYNPTSNTWSIGGPGVNSPDFVKLQDTTVTGYENPANTLVATSDQATHAYLFYDYSTRAQIKFTETDLTFTSLPVRPSGEQFAAGLY